MKRIITKDTINDFLNKLIAGEKAKVELLIQNIDNGISFREPLSNGDFVKITDKSLLVFKSNLSIENIIQKHFDINVMYNTLYFEDNQMKVKDLSFLSKIIFEKVQKRYSQFIELDNKVGIKDIKALYCEGDYWEYKLEKHIKTICTYYDINVNIDDIQIPTKVGIYGFDSFMLELEKDGTFYLRKKVVDIL